MHKIPETTLTDFEREVLHETLRDSTNRLQTVKKMREVTKEEFRMYEQRQEAIISLMVKLHV